jgi:predicted alpha/beta-hydrolase family hydrolase
MVVKTALPIKGYKGRPVANVLYRQSVETDSLGVIFGGWRYTTELPLLYFTRRILTGMGADVLAVDFSYSMERTYAKLSDKKRQEWFLADVRAAYVRALRGKTYKRCTAVGKSLGTLAVADLLMESMIDDSARLVWISPLLGAESIRTTLAETANPSLVVLGTHDESFSETNVRFIRRNSKLDLMVVERGDENIEAEGDVAGSAELVVAYINRLKAFLGLSREPLVTSPLPLAEKSAE